VISEEDPLVDRLADGLAVAEEFPQPVKRVGLFTCSRACADTNLRCSRASSAADGRTVWCSQTFVSTRESVRTAPTRRGVRRRARRTSAPPHPDPAARIRCRTARSNAASRFRVRGCIRSMIQGVSVWRGLGAHRLKILSRQANFTPFGAIETIPVSGGDKPPSRYRSQRLNQGAHPVNSGAGL